MGVLGATVVVPVGVGGVRDQLMPEEDVHQDVLLLQRVARHNGVTEHGSSQLLVDVGGGVVQDLTGQSGDVDTTIRLTSQPGLTANKLGVGLQKALDEVEVIRGSLVITGGILVVSLRREGESDTTRLLEVDDVGIGVPGVLSKLNITIIVHTEGTMFGEKTGQTGASGSTLVPEDKGVLFGGGALGFDQPVEDASVGWGEEGGGLVCVLEEEWKDIKKEEKRKRKKRKRKRRKKKY